MYGETGAAMRTEVAELLKQHRVQQRLVGPTPEAREQLGAEIRTYRQTVLVWLNQAMRAAAPVTFSNVAPAQPNPFRSAGSGGATPAGELMRAIELATQQSTASRATTETLATPNANPTIEHWRRAARAAALAEHDTTEAVSAQMTARQAQALVGDVAAMTQALVVLDQRYKNTPGWEPLAQSARLGWAALAAALDVSLGQPDYAVDHLGWRPKTKIIEGPARPGILGVLQAEHNLVIRMKTVPNATNLRMVVDSQRLLSVHLAPLAARIDDAPGRSLGRTGADLRPDPAGAPRHRRAARQGRTGCGRGRQRRRPPQGAAQGHHRRTAGVGRLPTALQPTRRAHRRCHRGRSRTRRLLPPRHTPPRRQR